MRKIILLITALCTAALLGCVIFVSKSAPLTVNSNTADKTASADATEAETTTEEETEPPTTIDDTIYTATFAAVGDNLIHNTLFEAAKQSDGSYNFDYLYANLTDYISGFDCAIINQETILGGTEFPISGYPSFNSPQEVGDALVKCGFDVVLSATNHTMDTGSAAVDSTIEFWHTKYPQITLCGINATEEEYNTIRIRDVNGIKVAFLNYTYGLNGYKVPEDRPYLVDMLTDKDKMASDIAAAKEQADFVIVCPHWGTEYETYSTEEEQELAQWFCDQGVDMIIGTHPHVLQQYEWITSDSTGNKTLCYYSLGNLASAQDRIARVFGGVAIFTLEKQYGKVTIKENGMNYTVMHLNYNADVYRLYLLSEYTDELATQNYVYSHDGAFTVQSLKDFAFQIQSKAKN